MINKILPLEKIREIALSKAKEILKELGILSNNENYAIKQYELQFKIYHAMKETLDI